MNSSTPKAYDFLIVGAGLFGATFAYWATQFGKKCLVIDQRSHTGGNTFCEDYNGIQVHKYGAHIFHTNHEPIWKFVTGLTPFNRYTNSPLANCDGKLYNLPFNMNTFYQLWGVITPEQAKAKLKEQTAAYSHLEPANLEEQALKLVGTDIYNKLIKGYTEKQWGQSAKDLPAFIIKRLPLRFTYDNNYFSDKFQGIPIGGYNQLTAALLKNIEVKLNVNFFEDQNSLRNIAQHTVYTGAIDDFFDHTFGTLEYRSLDFKHNVLDTDNYQGNAVVNYCDAHVAHTRIIEHKHFEFGTQAHTVITHEYPAAWSKGAERYYPVNNDSNNKIFKQYQQKALATEANVIFGGRLAEYTYYDMHQVIGSAIHKLNLFFEKDIYQLIK